MDRERKSYLKTRIAELEAELKERRAAAVGDVPLGQCRSNMCVDCIHAVVSYSRYGMRQLIGCAKDCRCDDFMPFRHTQ